MSSLRENLFLLARQNDELGIEKLIRSDSGELDERDDNGLTAIHICATFNCVEACAILLKLGAKHSLQVCQHIISIYVYMYRYIYI
jgi:ankyrin repeat protein